MQREKGREEGREKVADFSKAVYSSQRGCAPQEKGEEAGRSGQARSNDCPTLNSHSKSGRRRLFEWDTIAFLILLLPKLFKIVL